MKMANRLTKQKLFKLLLLLLCLILLWTFFGFRISDENSEDESFPHDLAYDIFIDETKGKSLHIPLDEEMNDEILKLKDRHSSNSVNPDDPIILWWTEFTKEPGKVRKCGQKKCFFTNDRQYMSHRNMKVFMFYGTDFDVRDLPLPRQKHHEWALLHEESPKNNLILCHGNAMSLFNHTSTFRRESDMPLSTQHLFSIDWLEQDTHMKTVSQKNSYQKKDGLAPIAYVQSDCDPPSDRDHYVKMLMKFIPVDSYGQCLNTKKLPQNLANPIEGMAHTEFYELLSRYKFALAMENAVCKDYMTEKLWRPLMVGTVPIVFGSPHVRDFLPDNSSAILVTDSKSVEDLATLIGELDSNDMKYDKMRTWKTTGVTNEFLRHVMSTRPWQLDDLSSWDPDHVNFVEAFECLVCERVHENMEKETRGEKIAVRIADGSHYGCPKRRKFDASGRYTADAGWIDFWKTEWEKQFNVAAVLKECVESKMAFCWDFISKKIGRNDF